MHDFSITGFIGTGTTLKQRVFKYLVGRSAGIVTIGKAETVKLREMFPQLSDSITYIPFGVDLDFFKPQQVAQHKTVFAVGFDPDRDWKTLIAAVEGTDLEVVIATKPSRLAGMTLPHNVTQKMFTQRELIDAYAGAAVVVLPMDTSKGVNDAMGCTTLFEAMAMGKAIVGTNTHTFASYITPEQNGLLVEEGDATALRSAIGRVLADDELRRRLEVGARTYAVQHLDIQKLTAELAQFFRKLVP
jgi:glycosyltransferase involved in cell wall biosynthesis